MKRVNFLENTIFVTMRIRYFLLVLLFSVFTVNQLSAQSSNATVYGIVTDSVGNVVANANVSLNGFPLGTTTDEDGTYLLRIPANREITLTYSFIGYISVEKTITATPEERIEVNISLEESPEELDEVQITSRRPSQSNMTTIDPNLSNIIPNVASDGVETLIKTLPGVSSNNEMSSQYSVRGGNFDENLVYVNGIEIYRPFLIKSGQQEGLSFINSDLVSFIEFSAGGFEAKYGDKMASVLDITYRKPTEFRGTFSASLLGGSVHMEDIGQNGKLSYIGGVRYKTNRYLLNSLDEAGDYNPNYTDIQAYINYEISEKLDISFLGNLARNKYNFIPQSRETTFGTYAKVFNAKIYFEGQEKDLFNTTLGALSADFHPNNSLNLKFTATAFKTREEINYDILGQYYINEFGVEDNASDSTLNLGVDSFRDHARDKLEAEVYNFAHRGNLKTERHSIAWGAKIQFEKVHDKVNEWEMRDSVGYSIPYSDEEIILYKTVNTNNRMSSIRGTAYVQDTYSISTSHGNVYITTGVRANYWDYSNELLISPRATIIYNPDWKANFSFHLSGGSYQQPAFFKELKDRDGNIHANVKAQRSQQVLLGYDYIFRAWDRPFKLTSELYYKYYSNLIPYQTDNVQIRYLADQKAKGYATGIDFKINGEFVSGVQSWASLSLLKTEENIYNDGHGWIPRPTDQLLNISLFFQDYFPGNPTYKMHLALYYGSRLPTGPPNSQRYQDIFRMPPYRRIDLGFSKEIINSETQQRGKGMLSHIKNMSVGAEILNLIDINNTVSYFWATTNSGDMYAVPNYLTGRKLNVKLNINF